MIVIDYDLDKVPDCEITLRSLLSAHGDTMVVQTPKGGYHVYHTYEDRFDDWLGVTGIDGYVDIRNNGNYVVGPGSVVNGKTYTIVNPSRPCVMPDAVFDLYVRHAVRGVSIKSDSLDAKEYELKLKCPAIL